jgi:hypothetical protein
LEVYKAKIGNEALANFRDVVKSSNRTETTTRFDCESAFYATKLQAGIRDDTKVKQTYDYIPILCSAWNKVNEFDRLTICFGAIAIDGLFIMALTKAAFAGQSNWLPIRSSVFAGTKKKARENSRR